MSFAEKSAWAMAAALVIAGASYAALIWTLSNAAGRLIPPLMPFIIAYIVVLTVIAIVSHVGLAAFAVRDASAPTDERDRIVQSRARSWSGYVFATGVLLALGSYLLVRNGDVLFYAVFGSLMLSQFSEYGFQIALYRGRA